MVPLLRLDIEYFVGKYSNMAYAEWNYVIIVYIINYTVWLQDEYVLQYVDTERKTYIKLELVLN